MLRSHAVQLTGAEMLCVGMKLCLVQVLTANQLVQAEESPRCVLANEGKAIFSLATICSCHIESMHVDSLIGTPSPSSYNISILIFCCFHPQTFYSLLAKGAFYFYYKNLILFDDRHLTQCLYS